MLMLFVAKVFYKYENLYWIFVHENKTGRAILLNSIWTRGWPVWPIESTGHISWPLLDYFGRLEGVTV
jgi:hypothetical protein